MKRCPSVRVCLRTWLNCARICECRRRRQHAESQGNEHAGQPAFHCETVNTKRIASGPDSLTPMDSVKWDEEKLKQSETERAAFARGQITEPKTPFVHGQGASGCTRGGASGRELTWDVDASEDDLTEFSLRDCVPDATMLTAVSTTDDDASGRSSMSGMHSSSGREWDSVSESEEMGDKGEAGWVSTVD